MGMDRTHMNEPDDPHGTREWTTERTPNEPEGAREWTERTQRSPGRTAMHLNEQDDRQGERVLTERIRRNPTTLSAHGNGLNAPYDPQGGRE